MKKKILAVIVAAIVLTMSAAPAIAHGSHHGRRSSYTSYTVCSISSCTESGLHSHNNQYYTGHYYGDGHSYHDYCDIADCGISGYHGHDGTYCFGHSANDGHGYHKSGRGHH